MSAFVVVRAWPCFTRHRWPQKVELVATLGLRSHRGDRTSLTARRIFDANRSQMETLTVHPRSCNRALKMDTGLYIPKSGSFRDILMFEVNIRLNRTSVGGLAHYGTSATGHGCCWAIATHSSLHDLAHFIPLCHFSYRQYHPCYLLCPIADWKESHTLARLDSKNKTHRPDSTSMLGSKRTCFCGKFRRNEMKMRYQHACDTTTYLTKPRACH